MMETERFEALIDAIIAIIITIIVLEIPLAAGGNLESLLELKVEFIAYAISFIVCFNMWKFTYNLFSIVNKINQRGHGCRAGAAWESSHLLGGGRRGQWRVSDRTCSHRLANLASPDLLNGLLIRVPHSRKSGKAGHPRDTL